MNRRKYLSTTLSLALIVLIGCWSWQVVWAQEAQPNTGSAIAGSQARLVVQLGHSETINAVTISADGRYVLTGSEDNTARLWEVETGREVRKFVIPLDSYVGPSISVESVALSPDGKYVLTGDEYGRLILWEAETGKAVRRFVGHSDWIDFIIISADGKYVLTKSWDGTARLWDIETGKELRRVQGSPVAISADGKYVLTGGDKTARLWDMKTGKEVQKFEGHSGPVSSAAFSGDGTYVVTGSDDQTARLWDTETGKEMRQFVGHSALIHAVAISADGKSVGTCSRDKTARLWEIATGREVHKVETRTDTPHKVLLSPEGNYALTSGDKTARLWDIKTGKEIQKFEAYSDAVLSVAVSADSKYVVTGNNDGTARLWETMAGKQVCQLVEHVGGISSVAISTNGKYVVTGGGDQTARLWEVETCKEVQRFAVPTSPPSATKANDNITLARDLILDMMTSKLLGQRGIRSVAISANGKYIATSSGDTTAQLWDTGMGREVRQFGRGFKSYDVVFSANGKYMATAGGRAQLWEVETGREVPTFVGQSSGVMSVAFAPNNKYMLTGNFNHEAALLEIETGKQVRSFVGHTAAVISVAFSPDGKYALTGSHDTTARWWEVETGKEVQKFVGHSRMVASAAISPDGKYVLTASTDSTTRLWDISTGKELCQVVSLRDGNWAIVAPDGRFDVSSLEEIKGLHWIMPDELMRTYPLEIFMRDYYEPRLLPRLLSGEQFKPIQSIVTLDRVQPRVIISDIVTQKDHPDLATVTVKVSKATGEFQQGSKKLTRETGVFDLRLFRDGQLVAQLPQFNPATSADKPIDATPEQMRKAWRERAKVNLEANGEQTITFKNIKLPRRADTKQVEFAAYAFNEDRVKSQTNRKTFDVPKDLAPVKGRAFVLTVGVNAYENRAWDLRFAANDARLAQRALYDGLKQSGEFAEVVNLSLISDAPASADAKPATKANFKAALEEIARQARPEDVVLIYYASHGYADRDGNYYFFTADTGPGKEKVVTPELLRRAISSDELSAWLRDVDAGEIALIIDACQSAGTVKGEAGEAFKPGPMGSRGLGQLAYDKRMRILAASQADDSAFETASLQHGLLTYALMKDGIEGRQADLNYDGQVTLTEALTYTLARVPKLYEAMRRGELAKRIKSPASRPRKAVNVLSASQKKVVFQQPTLFDFAKSRREIVLVR